MYPIEVTRESRNFFVIFFFIDSKLNCTLRDFFFFNL